MKCKRSVFCAPDISQGRYKSGLETQSDLNLKQRLKITTSSSESITEQTQCVRLFGWSIFNLWGSILFASNKKCFLKNSFGKYCKTRKYLSTMTADLEKFRSKNDTEIIFSCATQWSVLDVKKKKKAAWKWSWFPRCIRKTANFPKQQEQNISRLFLLQTLD